MAWIKHEYAGSVARAADGVGISMRKYSSKAAGYSIVLRFGTEVAKAAKLEGVERIAVMLGNDADAGKARVVPVAEGGFALKKKGSVYTAAMRPWDVPKQQKEDQANCEWRIVTPSANSKAIEFDLPDWARPRRRGALMAA